MLNRSPSSVSREFRRNSYSNGTYAAHHADKLYRKRRKNCGRKPKLKASAVRDYVLEKMALRWSPEQIAGRAKRDNEPFSISFPTIYRAIDTGILPPQLKKIMRFKWKHKKCKTEDKRGKIPNTTPISQRPAGAKNRTRFGHWESDTVLGQRKTGCFGTHVDIVNIALHISLKNFEQQCNGINIHAAQRSGYLFHCGGRRFARLIRVISSALLCRRHSSYRRAYPPVIPIAHVIAPYHCFQLFCRVIRASSAAAVKQFVLHSCPHTFAAGVVMTSASGAVHALLYPIFVQHGSV